MYPDYDNRKHAPTRTVMIHTTHCGKRAADLLLTSLAIAVLCPVLLAVAILVRVFLGKPVLFRQRRPGLHGLLFTCLKFRTMKETRDRAGNLLPDADRLTHAGRFLRRTSLDELPELLNVLRGDMSLVGPRPLLPEYLPRYTEFQQQRHQVKPGITGWAQINGRNALTWEQKFELDVWYVGHQSLALDLKILWLTLLIVLRGQGIEHGSHATMPEFLGSIEGTARS
jgi:sugar transferase EpsL